MLRDRGLPSYEKEPRRVWSYLFRRRWSRWDSLVVLCILLAGYDVTGFGPAWSAMLGHGTRGTFTVEQCTGHKRTCEPQSTQVIGARSFLRAAVRTG